MIPPFHAKPTPASPGQGEHKAAEASATVRLRLPHVGSDLSLQQEALTSRRVTQRPPADDARTSGRGAAVPVALPGTASPLDRDPQPAAVHDGKHIKLDSDAAGTVSMGQTTFNPPKDVRPFAVDDDQQFIALLEILRFGDVGATLKLDIGHSQWSQEMSKSLFDALAEGTTVKNLALTFMDVSSSSALATFAVAVGASRATTTLRSLELCTRDIYLSRMLQENRTPAVEIREGVWDKLQCLVNENSPLESITLKAFQPDRRVDGKSQPARAPGFSRFVDAAAKKESLTSLTLLNSSLASSEVNSLSRLIVESALHRLDLRQCSMRVGELKAMLDACTGVRRQFVLSVSLHFIDESNCALELLAGAEGAASARQRRDLVEAIAGIGSIPAPLVQIIVEYEAPAVTVELDFPGG